MENELNSLLGLYKLGLLNEKGVARLKEKLKETEVDLMVTWE